MMSNLSIDASKKGKGQTSIPVNMQNLVRSSAKIQKQKRFNPHRSYYL